MRNNPTRREFVRRAAVCGAGFCWAPRLLAAGPAKVFDARKYGVVGDGVTMDGPAIQRAVDAATADGSKAQVLVPGGRKYVIGSVELKGGIDFHLADDAELLLSTRPEDYKQGGGGEGAAILALGARGLSITGSGRISGRARAFMAEYDAEHEIWQPKPFRPKMFVLTGCRDLTVRDITFGEAPNWGLHLLGCEDVLVDHVTVRNLLDVPNCDGIDPDHSRRVEIRNCDIRSGDDAIVVKTSRQAIDYGPAANIHVHDCVIETQDAGVKVGTETTSDIHDVLFERCEIRTSSRGLCIQLRDEADVRGITFRDIRFRSRFYSDPWWGRGEGISFTALPRKAGAKVGTLSGVRVERVTGVAENSVRVRGCAESRVRDVRFSEVDVRLERSTRYPGGLFDNRPTTALTAIEPHGTPGFSLEHADGVVLDRCRLSWGAKLGDSFSAGVEERDCTGVRLDGFVGEAARPGEQRVVVS